MGNVWQKLLGKYFNKADIRILMCGLDAAGKTTALYKLKLGEVVTTIPTIGFNVESITYKHVNLVAWDVGGRDKIRPLWRHYYDKTDVLIFVIDSNDRERMPECKDELHRFLAEDLLKDAVVLVMANKQDLPNAMSVEEISQELGVDKIQGRRITVQATCAVNGEGLYEGLSWIQSTLGQKELKKSVVKPVKEVVATPEGKPQPWWSIFSNYFTTQT